MVWMAGEVFAAAAAVDVLHPEVVEADAVLAVDDGPIPGGEVFAGRPPQDVDQIGWIGCLSCAELEA